MMGNDARDEDVHAVDEHLTDDLLGDVEQPTDGESLTEGSYTTRTIYATDDEAFPYTVYTTATR